MDFDPDKKDWSILIMTQGSKDKFVDFIRGLTHKEMLQIYEAMHPKYECWEISFVYYNPEKKHQVNGFDVRGKQMEYTQEHLDLFEKRNNSRPKENNHRYVFGPDGWSPDELKEIDARWPQDYSFKYLLNSSYEMTSLEVTHYNTLRNSYAIRD